MWIEYLGYMLKWMYLLVIVKHCQSESHVFVCQYSKSCYQSVQPVAKSRTVGLNCEQQHYYCSVGAAKQHNSISCDFMVRECNLRNKRRPALLQILSGSQKRACPWLPWSCIVGCYVHSHTVSTFKPSHVGRTPNGLRLPQSVTK